MSSTVVTPRYRILDPLGEGGMGRVYRTEDRLTGRQVALKEVILDDDQAVIELTDSLNKEIANLRLALTHEFRLMASLRHPNIVSVLDYGFTESHQPFYTMELLPNAQPITEATKGADERLKILYLIQTLQALAYLHRRGILHRDLKPENILVSEGKVYILDFGLSANVTDPTNSAHIVGSLLYIAPEVLDGGTPTLKSDLYAIGVVAYEMFAGRHPYYDPDTFVTIEDLFRKGADLQLLNASGMVKTVIANLLSSQPSQRFSTTQSALAAFQEAASIPIEIETSTVRESYLQASHFVGRDAELEQLMQALGSAIEGHGSLWFIGGESGIGKSRLVDEFRIRALTAGAQVITGQAVREGGTPYQLWRDVVAHLALNVSLSDTTLAALQWIQPAIGTITGHPNLAATDEHITNENINNAALTLFRSQPQTIVLILEDLQWAAGDLELLKRLNAVISSLKILVVGSYRDDELPGLPKEIPDAHVLKLERLSESSLGSLVESMIGSLPPGIFSFLQRETEGNIFFLVETIRALAEEAGSLANIAHHTLPASIFTGGIQAIVERRLNQVTGTARALLDLAAVIGRAIDLPVIRAINPELDIDSWLLRCADASILDVQDNQWRFAHDKLREGVLKQLGDTSKMMLHRQVAECLEQLYGDDDSRAGQLAYHWGGAENLDKEYLACINASRYYLQVNIFRDARRFAERALFLSPQRPDTQQARLEAITYLAPAYWQLGDYKLAQPLIEQGLEDATARGEQTHFIDLSLTLGRILRRQGESQQGQHHLQAGLETAKQLGDQRRVAQALLASITPLMDTEIAEAQRIAQEALRIYRELGEELGEGYAIARLAITMIETKDIEESRRLVKRARDIFLKHNVRSAYVSVLQNLIDIEIDAGNLEPAMRLAEDGLRMAQEMGSQMHIAMMLQLLGLCSIQLNRLADAEHYAREAIVIFRSMHEVSWLAFTLASFGHLLYLRQNLTEALTVLEEALALAETGNMSEIVCMALTNLSIVLSESGEVERAKSTLSEALKMAQEWGVIDNQLAVVEALLYYLSQIRQFSRLVECGTFLLQHPSTNRQVKTTAQRCLEQAKSILTVSQIADAEQRSQALTYDKIVEESSAWLADA